jgi:hypothetical protein
MLIRDRIRELRRVRACDLRPNSKNWRTHPQAQQDALRGVLAEIGYADALIVRELPDGTLQLLDGHLRAETTPEADVPVLVVDLTEAEADKVLATLDPLAAMAEADKGKLDALLRDVQTGSEALAGMLADLAKDSGILAVPVEDEATDPPVNPISLPGDMWLLGDHRLFCGDSTNRETVLRLLDGRRPQLMIVDPPFDLAYSQWDIPDSCDVLVVWGRGDERLKWEAQNLCGKYGVHELVYTGGVRGHARPSLPCCLHDVVHVWRRKWWKQEQEQEAIDGKVIRECGCAKTEDDRPFSVQEHCGGVLTGAGAMSWGKPVLAMAIATAYVPAGSLIYDPCAGSGSSLVAAQRHGRRWIGCELQPQWADLCVARWEKESGLPATVTRGGKVWQAQDLRDKMTAATGAETPVRPEHEQAEKEPAHV